MQYETITKEQIESIVKTGKIKPVEEESEVSEAKNDNETTEKKSSRGRKPKATDAEEEK